MATLQDIAVQIAIASVPLGVAFFAFKSATDANKRTQATALATAERQAAIERTKVDAEAFQRAKSIYEDALTQLEKQLDRLQEQFDRISEQLAKEQDSSNAMRDQMRALQGHIQTLERTVAALRRQLTTAGLKPAPGELGTGPFPVVRPPGEEPAT